MKKRGQAEVLTYIIIAVTIIGITWFGYSMVTKVTDKICKTELAKFEIDLQNLDKSVKFGSADELDLQAPCNAEEIYFFDLNKDINLDFLNHIPLMKDSLANKVEKNIFLVKDNEVISSFYAGNLDVWYPNYICFLPKFEKINFFVEGKGKQVAIFAGCNQPECTNIPVETLDDAAIRIIDESAYFSDGLVDIGEEFEDFYETNANVKIFRKYEYCREDGKTNVEIIVRPNQGVQLKNFRFFESIPKDCIDDLDNYLSTAIEGDVEIKSDPLIMWKFEDIKKEQRFSYLLDKILSEECRDTIEGLGIAKTVEGGKQVVVPDVDITDIKQKRDEGVSTNTAPTLSIPLQVVNANPSERQLVVPDLWSLTQDEKPQDLLYEVKDFDSDVMSCDIENKNQLWCIAKENEIALTEMTVSAFDGEFTAEDTFDVRLTKWSPAVQCGDGTIDSGEACDGTELNSQTCQSQGFVGGGLSCDNNCEFDTSDCLSQVCGNGQIENTEQCDDSNTNNGDGCSSSCAIETGYSCSGIPSTCSPSISKFETLSCRQTKEDCDYPGKKECKGFQKKNKIGKCVGIFNEYLCTNDWSSGGCVKNPTCPGGYSKISSSSCTIS
jgi:cysteine-rich repeat protein